MSSVAAVAAAEGRQRWRSLLLLALLTAVWVATIMAASAGARRTTSALDWFTRRTMASDASFALGENRDGTALLDTLRRHPDVVGADLLWGAGTGLAFDDRGVFVNIVGSHSGVWRQDLDRPIVLAGRRADPTRPDEVMITEATADLLDARPGDVLRAPTWDRAEFDRWSVTRGPFPAFNGPVIDLTVVAVVRVSSDLRPFGGGDTFIDVTPAFVAQWAPLVGHNPVNIITALRPNAEAADIAAWATTELGQTVTVVTSEEDYGRQLRHALRVMNAGLWILAASVAVSGGALIALANVRAVRHVSERLAPLRALGATHRQRVLCVAAAPLVATLGGVLLGVVGALAASPLFPIGPGRLAEPTRSFRADWTVLGLGALVTLAALGLAIVAGALGHPSGPERASRRGRLSGVFERLGPGMAIGGRHAWGTRRRFVTPSAAAVVLGGLLAATWFATSLAGLRDDPARWGYTWSSSPDIGFAFPAGDFDFADLPEVARTVEHPGIAGLGVLATGTTYAGTHAVAVYATDHLGGVPMQPAVLDGRVPVTALEIAVGEVTSRRLGVHVGDLLELHAPGWPAVDYRVVGIIVPPYRFGSTEPGDGAFTTFDGILPLFPEEGLGGAGIVMTYAPNADAAAVEADLERDPGWRFRARSHPRLAGAVKSLLETRVIAGWLIAFFAVGGVTAAGVAASRRSGPRAREVGVLRALGFTPRNLFTAVVAETAILGAVALVLGMASGIVLGRLTWELATGDLGVVDVRSSLVVPIVATAALAIVSGTVAVAVAWRRGVGRSTAEALRAG